MNGKLRTIVRSLRNNELVWRYGYNFAPTLNYSIGKENGLSKIEQNVLYNLNRDGIALTSIDDLFDDDSEFRDLSSTVDGILESRKEEIARLESKAADTTSIGSKTFNMELLGSELTFDSSDIFARFALKAPALNLANAYLRMYAKLRYYNVWYTFASAAAARESQLWHFDREDNYILKIFLYLDDVDEGSGPFTYAPGTHKKGRFRSIDPEFFLEGGVRRSTDEQMAGVFPRKNWRECVGKKGTVIFADTRGYHKGGAARTKDRPMYTCMYTSPASESKELIKFPSDFNTKDLTRKQLMALGTR